MRFIGVVVVLCACGGSSSQPDAGAQADAGDIDASVDPPDAAPPDADDSDAMPLAAPVVSGELSAGHPAPVWTWTTPAGAAGFRYRLDDGAWQVTSDATTTRYDAATLPEGTYLFQVEARDAGGAYGDTGVFTTTIEYFNPSAAWSGAARTMRATPYGNRVAVGCQNCYDLAAGDPATNLAGTLADLHAAQNDGADLLEIDVVVQGGQWRVDSADDGVANGPLLADVLADAALQAGDQLLVIEVLEVGAIDAEMRALADVLIAAGYATNGRPVIMRGTEAVKPSLDLMRAAVTAADYPFNQEYFRWHLEVAGTAALPTFMETVAALADVGWHGIVLAPTAPNLAGATTYALNLGLRVSVRSLSLDADCGAFRHQAQGIMMTPNAIALCASIVQEASALVRIDVTGQFTSPVTYHGTSSSVSYTEVADGLGRNPELVIFGGTAAAGLYAVALDFQPGESDALSLHDADNNAADGYLVTAVVNFDSIALAENETQSLVAKSDAGGFALELHRPTGDPNTYLRFGAHVSGVYHYAYYDAAGLSTDGSYFIVAGYDGNGAVRIFVNGVQGTPSSALTGGITQNDSPIVLGADPQGATDTRFYFDGQLQRVTVTNWTNH